MTNFRNDSAFAQECDSHDPLSRYRDGFYIPKGRDGKDVVYLCGHSLGLQPKAAREYVNQELQDWALLGVEGHFHAKRPWIPYHEFLAPQTARLLGAKVEEVVVMNSLTVNLHLMMVSFYRPTPSRNKILIEANAFPSDQYAVKSQLRLHGFDPKQSLVEIAPRDGETVIRTEDIERTVDQQGDSIALIMLGGVQYLTGQAFEMEHIVRIGHAKGCIVGFDLAHAIGNIPMNLHEWGVDFAVWCSYKYLNGGPGATAGCFVHERHLHNSGIPRFAGWWGHNKASRFAMPPEFDPIPTAEGWQLSNPPILSTAALRASLDMFDEAGMEKIRGKSRELTGYLEFLIDQISNRDFEVITPRNPEHRGAQLSLHFHPNGKETFKRLADANVICDWREPNVIRVAPIPLYNSFADVYRFVEVLANRKD
jgi:kynureninase